MMRPLWILLATIGLLSPPSGQSGGALVEQTQPTAETVEELARNFRMRVYRTFRQHRVEHDRRRVAWARVEAAWKAAGSRTDQRDKLVGWLSTAIRVSTPGTLGPPPKTPRFKCQPDIPPIVEHRRPAVRSADEPVLVPAPAVSRLAVAERALPVDLPRRPDVATGDPAPLQLPPTSSVPRKLVAEKGTRFNLPERPGGCFAQIKPGPFFGSPELLLPDALAKAEPPVVKMPATPQTEIATAGSHDTAAHRRHVGQLPPVDRSAEAEPPIVEMPAKPQAEIAAASSLHRAGPKLAEQSGLPAARTPVALPPLDASAKPEPVAQTPAAKPQAVVAKPQVVVAKPQTPVANPQAAVSPRARVNLTELAARIAGNNLATRALESELDREQTWTARQLEPLVAQLRHLIVRTSDLQLYHDLVPEGDRWLVGRAESPDGLVPQLAARIVEARTRAARDLFPGSDAERIAELERLDHLSRTLAELVQIK